MRDTMRDLLSKLDGIVNETSLRDREDLEAKRKALQDLQMDPNSKDPEISQAIVQRKADLEKEAKAKGFSESFEIGDEFGISFSEDHEIATTIVDILEDGIVVELINKELHFTRELGAFKEGRWSYITEERFHELWNIMKNHKKVHGMFRKLIRTDIYASFSKQVNCGRRRFNIAITRFFHKIKH